MNLDEYDVIWDSPSENARGSMPLGNGDIALNAWVEADGDLQFYIGKTDAWDDNSRLLKVGRVRVSLSPNPFREGGTFRQALRLRGAEMVVTASAPGATDAPVEVRLWVDANHPVIHVTVESKQPLTATASFELWRTAQTALPSLEYSDIYQGCPQPPPTITEPDTVLENLPEGIGWYHRNVKSVGPELTMTFQDLAEGPWKDPLLHRTFGALIRAQEARRVDDRHLESPNGPRHRFSITVLTKHPATQEQWLAGVREIVKKTEAVDFHERRKAHLAWWESFWGRSHVYIRDREAATATGNGHDVARGYNLQRFITACAGRGAYPIKFNGSLFVMPWPGRPCDADYRQWGPDYWWQNSRLPYASSCAAGDFDLMEPLFRMYGGEVLDVCTYRTKRYFGFDGAYFPECIYPWGAVFMESYGWGQRAAERTDKLQTSGFHKWEWVSGLELVFMMLDRHDHTRDDTFLADRVIPTAIPVLAFFDGFYKTNADGKLVMHPSQAVETWWDCTNPMPELAGLHAVTARLLALPVGTLSEKDRRFVESLQKKLPDLPTREEGGARMLAPAERFDRKSNSENPELYAVFPFRLVSFEKANADLGVQALRHRWDRGDCGWRQDDVFMAYLGLAQDAKDNVVGRAEKKDPECRFPAFWGPNADWTPDQDHGGVLMKTVQSMLMQTEGRKIFLLPAWPSDWDADFKLHAPDRTILEGTVRNGRLASLKVTPAARQKDITTLDSQ
ncbi:MAG: DUF5703 domain-containing protein [Planctomycetota bacterium]|nr:DUF5703 domain-containing protein [Planctomycetota bacterium]